MSKFSRIIAVVVIAIILIMAAPTPPLKALNRYSGEDRYATAVEICKSGWANGSDVVILTRGDVYVDALASVPLAYAHEAPVLLTLPNRLPAVTKNEIIRLNPSKIIIIGGSTAVSKGVEDEIKALGVEITRIKGHNRFDTAAAIAAAVAPEGAESVVLAYGLNFPDALAAASYAAISGSPILLTLTDKLPEETAAALEALNPEHIYVVGGTAVISDSVVKGLQNVERISGPNRFATAVALAEKFATKANFMFVATGNDKSGGADAITGAALAAKEKKGILLVGNSLPPVVEEFLGKQIEDAVILGGSSAVSVEVAEDVQEALYVPTPAERALAALNAAETYMDMKPILEEKADVLGLDLTSYNKLIDDRKPSVSFDLFNNKPEEDYTLENLKEYFDAIVATRHATQVSMDHVNNTESADALGISWVTDLLAQFKTAGAIYNTHSGIALSDKVTTLQALLDRYNALAADKQAAALQQVFAGRPYTRSQSTTAALDAALTAQEGVVEVEIIIAALPAAEELTLPDYVAVQAARAAYEALTDAQKALVNNFATLVAAEGRIEELVLADVDNRITAAIEQLVLDNTGITEVTYANRTATFLINEPDTNISAFAGSGVIDLFLEMFTDVTNADIYIGANQVGTIANPAQMSDSELRGAILNQLILPLVGENPTMTLKDLVGKSASAELTISAGLNNYKGTYSVEFVAKEYTVSVSPDNGTVTGAGAYAVGTEVEITVTAPEGMHVVSFTVNGADHLPELVGGKYTFTITGDVAVTVTYAVNQYTVTFVDWDGTVIDEQTIEHGNAATEPGYPTREGYTFTGWDVAFANVTGDLIVTAQWQINQYTITFDSAGGSDVAAITGDYGTAIAAPEAPTREGYTFTGWNPEVPETMPAGDLTLTAQWEINQYTITFDSAGGSVVAAITQDYGTAVVAPEAPTREGYTFVGWSPEVPTTMPAENITLTAQWQINQYTITFDSAGGSAVTAITQDYGTAVTAPEAPTREGYTFTGWSPEVPATMPAENITLTAQWQVNQYTITFDSAGGSAVEAVTGDYDTAVTAPAAPTREGYTFIGWDPVVPAIMPAENITLTAQWKINQYTITFDSAGGSEVAAITGDYGTAVIAPEEPTREGYTFTGWSPAVPEIMPAGNVTLTAQWEINQYTITYDCAGGSAVAAITGDYGTAVVAPEAPTREGYTFVGWSPAVPETMPAGDLTLTAQWQINQYTITFDSAGGSAVAAITGDYGTAVAAPEDPTREGYTFVGWSPAVPETMPAGDLTLTAQWQINQYTITFDSAGGSAVAAITGDYGMAVTAPADPTREGYTFAGWSPEVPTTMPAGDVTLTAQWEINQYTITFDSGGGSAVAAITQDYGTTVIAPEAPTRVGYTFIGWSPAVPATMPAGNVTLTAQWQINQYTITFDSTGGSAVAAITGDYGMAVTAPADPTREGFTFTGWDPEVPATMPAGDLTLTAQWEINQYTITFENAGGSAVAAITQDYGTTVIAPEAPTRVGYTFIGWSPAVPATMPAGNVTLTAQWEINQYTITFDSAGGSAVEAITGDYGTAVVAPEAPTREGYTFTGWDPEVPASMPAENLTLTAQWEINQYTITFDSAGGSAVEAITGDYGTAMTAPANPTREGYTFVGWSPAVPETMPAGDVTLTAQWTVNQYTITFDSAGGSAVTAITQDYGTAVTAPAAPTRVGYIFTGWSPAVPETMPAENFTLTAQWEINQYTITFDSAGGSAVAAITGDYGTAVTAPEAPTRVGYTFVGWSPAVPATMPAGNVTLTAQWQVNQYTITFDSAGGSAVAAITQDYGTAVTATEAPTKAGYTFTGWSPEVPATMPAGNITLTAQWQINQYIITFESAGGSAVTAITQDYGTAVVTPEAPTREGYTFVGWSPAVPTTMPAGNVTLTAQWQINQYTITFDSAGGSEVAAITGDYGSAVVAPEAPTREGYTFVGWSPAVPAAMPAGNVTLTAQWEINQYTITFNSSGGSAVAPITQDYGTAVAAPEAPIRVGYTFTGWCLAVPATMPAGDLTLTAQWTINSYTVTVISINGDVAGANTYDFGSSVTLTATAATDYEFYNWTDEAGNEVSKANPYTFTMGSRNLTLTANFVKTKEAVLADVDTRIINAVSTLDLTDTGITDVIYANRYATFLINNPDKQIIAFASSGIVGLFQEMFTDVINADIYIGEEQVGTIVNPTDMQEYELMQAIANELILPLVGEGNLGGNLSLLVGKSATAELTISAGPVNYKARYTVEFVAQEYTVSVSPNNGTVTGAGAYAVGTEVEITVTAPEGMHIAAFTVNGADQLPLLVGGKYTFTITEDVTVAVTYAINEYTVTFVDWDGTVIDQQTIEHGNGATEPVDPIREGYTFTGWDVVFANVTSNLIVTAQWEINQYTITFDSAGGSEVAPITQDYGTAVIAPEVPTRAGYTFVGWSPAVPATMPAGDVTLTAQWEINQYTITFDSAGGSAVAAITGDYGTAVVAPEAPTREGYTFTGWSPEAPTTMPAGDVTLTAQWEINQYTITFDSTGGSAVAAITGDYGTAIAAPEAPTREGYTFVGWDQAVPATMPAGDLTLTAQWEINQYTITFDSTGGSAVAAITGDYGTAIAAPEAPTREGYTFVGWSPAVPETMPAGDLTLTAQWQINQYTITFDSAGGSAVAAITGDYGMALTAPADPTREGYTFTGWSLEVPATMPAEDITLTAQWEINQYTITFDSAGGSAVAAITGDYDTAVTAPAAPTKVGYTFVGWSPVVPETMPAGDLTLTAQWEINQYTITFDSAGGSAVASIIQDYGTVVTAPDAPTREGYTFVGWSPAVPTTMPAGDLTLTAQWEINQYTITFDSTGGSAVAAITGDYGTAVTAPANPTREGYTFVGWNPEVPAAMPAGDLTLTAQWTINSYTVTVSSINGDVAGAGTYDFGSRVTLTATAAADYEFFNLVDEAGNEVSKANPYTFTMGSRDMTLTANFIKTKEAVLADVDTRVSNAVELLVLDNTGITEVTYAGRLATFLINEPDTNISAFAGSGVLDLFQQMFTDVTNADIFIGVNQVGTIVNPAQMSDSELKGAILNQLILPLVGENPTMTLNDLVGKSATAEMTISAGLVNYKARYTVEFVAETFGLTTIAENGTVTGAGTYAVGSRVNLTATANTDYEFYNWVDEAGNVVSTANPYTFTMVNRDLTLTAVFVKTEAAVLADVDTRINNGVGTLDLTDTGIADVIYANRHATFLISDPDKPITAFASSGIVGLFQEMFTDVINADIYIGEEQVGTIVNPTAMTEDALMRAIADELILPLVGEGNLGGNLSLLVGKSATAELTISAGLVNYKAAYTVEFDLFDRVMARPVINQIAALPDAITLADKKAVQAARSAYQALTVSQQAFVTNLDKLIAAEAGLDLAGAKAAAGVLTPTDYTTVSWHALSEALALPEDTTEQVLAKTAAINDGITNLAFKDQANSVWDGSSEVFSLLDPDNTENSEANPYVVDTAAKFAELATQVNNGNDYAGNYFILDANLNLNNLPWTTIGYSGSSDYPFSGYFNGNNHAIAGLKIESKECTGLFAVVSDGQIKNLTLLNPSVTYNKEIQNSEWVGNIGVVTGAAERSTFENIHVINPTITGGWWIGGICGWIYDVSITNCSVTGGSIDAVDWSIGGITAGGYDAIITNCHVDGTSISTTAPTWNNYIGGIAGQLEIWASEKNIVQNCSFNGSITAQYDYAGGIVAYVASGATEITNCTSTGTLNGSGGYVGGILGADAGATTIADSISFIETAGSHTVGGIIGRGTASSAIKNSTSVGSVSGASNVGQIVGSGAVVYTTAEVFPEITALSGGNVSDIRKISDANGYMLRGSIEVGLEDTFVITFATTPNLRVYLDNVLLVENEGYTVADNSISIPMPVSGVHKLVFITQEADDNLNAALVVDAAPYAAMPSLMLKHGEETINLNANNNSYFTNYNDDSGKSFIVEVGDYDSSVTLNVSMSPASYQAADYYDAVNRRYVFPGSAFTEDVAVEFVASQEGLVDKTIKFTLKYSPFSGGLGSAESPYLISKAEQFLSMANDAHYLIINDIDFSHIKTWSNFSLGRFTLDGGNHSLIGLGSAPNSNFYGGLFSFVSGRCVIKNLNLVDVDLTFTQAAGVLIGKVYSDDNSRKTQATEVTITNCHANGVVSTSSMVCGLVGESTGSGNKIFISNSSVDLAIKGDSYVGGFVGTVWDGEVSITDCIIDGTYSGSEYVGGAIGYAKDADGVQIDNVINYAAVNASSSYGAGFIGYGTSACAVRNTINASRIIGSGSDLHAISNVGEFFPEYAAMPEIAACSSGNLSNIVKTYEGASLANQFLQLDSDISSFSVTFAAGTDFSNMAVYLDSALLASSDYAIAGDTVTVTFTPGSHKILFVFSEADKESSVFYVDFAKSYTLVLAYDDREGTVVGTANGSNYTFNIGEAGNLLAQWTTIELTAAAKEGFTFIGWTTSGNEIISYDATYTFDLFRDVTITPLFYQENPADVARIRSTGYGSLEAALADAVTGNIVILLQDYTLTQNITVPQDVMLLLPCGANDYVGYMDTGFNPDGTSTDKSDLSVLYKTLTVPEGVTVTIEGTVLVNAVTGRPAAGTYLQDITGGYSQINLAGNIVVAQGGLLDVFGKITGTGMIEALAGGSVGDLYVVKNWRGGSQAADCYFMNIFPFNEYDLHNIEASLKINSGASYYGNVKMYASYRYYYTRFYQFDGTKGLIKLATGAYAVKTYDSASGQTTITINGGAEEIGGSMTIAGMGVSTKGFIFPVDGHIAFVLENGNYAVNNKLKFLPGSALTIGTGATFTVNSGAQLIIYEEFIDAPNTGDTQYPLRAPAQFNLDGTLVIEGAFGGFINAGTSAQVVIGSNAILEVSSHEANGYRTSEYTVYTVTTNLGIDLAPDLAWYYYPTGGDINSAVLVASSYEGMEYINLNLDAASYIGHTFVVK